MTRSEFEAFAEGQQWTPQQLAMFNRRTPIGDGATVETELRRMDGIIGVEPYPPRRSLISQISNRLRAVFSWVAG